MRSAIDEAPITAAGQIFGMNMHFEADDGSTTVTLTYDWSRTTQKVRDAFDGFPVVSPEYLEESLATLEQATTASS